MTSDRRHQAHAARMATIGRQAADSYQATGHCLMGPTPKLRRVSATTIRLVAQVACLAIIVTTLVIVGIFLGAP